MIYFLHECISERKVITMQGILYLITILITHHAASIIQASLHCFLGHRKKGGFIHTLHAYEHHGIYSKDFVVSDSYLDEAKSLDYLYAVPALLLAAGVYSVVSLDYFLVHIAALALSTFAHLYLHVQYHLKDSPLKRYHWFQTKRRLHLLHHEDMTRNFAVVEFVWDRLMGTYQDAPLSAKL
jgi:sterol desaturase/sphingolipid hydroxylase (fatty acid hydroxylase superfamily)